jgi:hypothetical protein
LQNVGPLAARGISHHIGFDTAILLLRDVVVPAGRRCCLEYSQIRRRIVVSAYRMEEGFDDAKTIVRT